MANQGQSSASRMAGGTTDTAANGAAHSWGWGGFGGLQNQAGESPGRSGFDGKHSIAGAGPTSELGQSAGGRKGWLLLAAAVALLGTAVTRWIQRKRRDSEGMQNEHSVEFEKEEGGAVALWSCLQSKLH